MSNYNKVLLMGRLTRDPELRYTPQGVPVTEIGLAMNREYMVGTERRKETTFVDVTLWRRQAEVVCQYLKKGGPIFIEGHLSLDTWEAQDGQKRQKLRVIAENFQFMGSKQDGEGSRSFPPDDSAQSEGGFSPAGPARRPLAGKPGGPPAQGRDEGDHSPSRYSQPGGSRIPNEAFSPLSEREGASPGSTQEGDSDAPLGVDEGEIPF